MFWSSVPANEHYLCYYYQCICKVNAAQGFPHQILMYVLCCVQCKRKQSTVLLVVRSNVCTHTWNADQIFCSRCLLLRNCVNGPLSCSHCLRTHCKLNWGHICWRLQSMPSNEWFMLVWIWNLAWLMTDCVIAVLHTSCIFSDTCSNNRGKMKCLLACKYSTV